MSEPVTTVAEVLRRLSNQESVLLGWLGQEEYSQYGECHGAALDSLIAKGLAQVHDDPALGNFIARGTDKMYRAVSLTDAGRATLAPQTPTEEM